MRWPRRAIAATLTAALGAAVQSWGPPAAAEVEDHAVPAIRAADFILSLQNEHGAILDHPDSRVANTDSKMQYALWGLAAAYTQTGAMKYLDGMRTGLLWLADRQRNNGSWWIGYRATPPFTPKKGAYGVSATVGLFIYDLWLYREVGGDPAVVRSLLPEVRAGLRFLRGMRAPDGTYYSAFGRDEIGRYQQARYRFTSDQADVYLGLRASWDLLERERSRRDGGRLLRTLTGPAFFYPGVGRYAQGLDQDGRRDPTMDVLTIWPNGYVPWVLGESAKNRKALSFLGTRQMADGGFKVWGDDPVYSLTAEVFVMGTSSVYGTPLEEADRAAQWLVDVASDQLSGGIVNNLRNPRRYCNIAGFGVLAWLRTSPPIP